jgi:hypothetical protein
MVAPGQTLVIQTSGGAGVTSVGMDVVEGPVSSCVLVDAPLPPAPPAQGVSSSGGRSQGTSTSSQPQQGPSTSTQP